MECMNTNFRFLTVNSNDGHLYMGQVPWLAHKSSNVLLVWKRLWTYRKTAYGMYEYEF